MRSRQWITRWIGMLLVAAPIMAEEDKVGEKFRAVQSDPASGKVRQITAQTAPVVFRLALGWWDFDKAGPGKLPQGWSMRQTKPSKAAEWAVAADENAPSRPHVLKLKTESDRRTFNLAVMDKASFQDLDMSVRIRADSGKVDQGGGLIWRCQDENNYYICRVNPLESNYRAYRVVNGKREQIQSADVKTEAGQWYTLRAVMVGDHLTCHLDGKKLLEATDGAFKGPGMIGLWTKADAASSFDDLVVLPAGTGKEHRRKHEAGEQHQQGQPRPQGQAASTRPAHDSKPPHAAP